MSIPLSLIIKTYLNDTIQLYATHIDYEPPDLGGLYMAKP